MKNSLFSLVAALGLLTTAGVASAQTATPAINAAQASERARIRQGVASGQLTPAETARLRAREAEISSDRKAARADGVVTRDERQDIRKDEQKASAAIYRQKHDAQSNSQPDERARIRQGVASGQLTPTEAARLRAREADISRDKKAARADGVVTRDERQDIRKDQNQASRAIYRQKHDAQVRR